jgi:pimeloyl-ACP methyl ester carboxylesterase
VIEVADNASTCKLLSEIGAVMPTHSASLILIPGLLCDARLWGVQTTALADVVRCQIPDLAACATIEEMAESVLTQAPDEFALAGFSMGGCVALEILARAPQRVRQLALLSTSAAGLLQNVRRHYQESIANLLVGGLATYLADAYPRYVAPERVHDPELWQTFSAMGRDLGSAVAVRQMRALLGYRGFSGDLAAIDCPTTLICGLQDERTPVTVHEAMARRIPASELVVIESAGHFTPLEQPNAVTAALLGCLNRTSRKHG